MKYRVTHRTTYTYSKDVTLCHNVAHLLLRNTPQQTCYLSELQITPLPACVNEWQDLFGNRQASFSIQKPHDELVVTSISEIEVASMKSLFDGIYPISWQQAIDHLQTSDNTETVDARLFTLESEFIEFQPEVASYCKPSFTSDRPLLEAVEDLMHRIYRDFTYEPGFTTVATPLREVLKHKKGVCQDFAHLAIACLRMQGLAARYISGYLETIPPQGVEKLQIFQVNV